MCSARAASWRANSPSWGSGTDARWRVGRDFGCVRPADRTSVDYRTSLRHDGAAHADARLPVYSTRSRTRKSFTEGRAQKPSRSKKRYYRITLQYTTGPRKVSQYPARPRPHTQYDTRHTTKHALYESDKVRSSCQYTSPCNVWRTRSHLSGPHVIHTHYTPSPRSVVRESAVLDS